MRQRTYFEHKLSKITQFLYSKDLNSCNKKELRTNISNNIPKSQKIMLKEDRKQSTNHMILFTETIQTVC